jgi:predicted RNA methylase
MLAKARRFATVAKSATPKRGAAVSVIPFKAGRFSSTAAHYDYRVPYPPALVEAVAARIGLQPGDAVLDLGCGPAQLGIAFAGLGMRVVAMDPEPEMLSAASAAAARAGVNISVLEGSSYDLKRVRGPFRLVAMGRSFHWMDRPATLAVLDTMIEDGGAVALFHDRRVVATPDWPSVVASLSDKFVPKSAETTHHSSDWLPHEVMLLQSRFSAVETIGRTFVQTLGIDDVVRRALSMSVTSPEALGEHRETFETSLRRELKSLASDGHLSEVVTVEAMLAFRAPAS